MKRASGFLGHPLFRKYSGLVREELRATFSRDVHKWLLVAPITGVVTGLVVTGVAIVILRTTWPVVLQAYVNHHWLIVPGLLIGFLLTGLIMQYRTPNPNEHSTEEIIRSYHEHQGAIDMKPFWWKLLAAVTTVGSGGSAALEGPSIYGGGAIGSWLWTRLQALGLQPHDRRIMLISGAAAGMAAVFRAPLTGMIFALEMPYKDDLAHEALLPSLIASVVAYATMVAFLGSEPLFGFSGSTAFSARRSAVVGAAGCWCAGWRRWSSRSRSGALARLRSSGDSAHDEAPDRRLRHRDLRTAIRNFFRRSADAAGAELRSGARQCWRAAFVLRRWSHSRYSS